MNIISDKVAWQKVRKNTNNLYGKLKMNKYFKTVALTIAHFSTKQGNRAIFKRLQTNPTKEILVQTKILCQIAKRLNFFTKTSFSNFMSLKLLNTK
jgi:hypothetical protein